VSAAVDEDSGNLIMGAIAVPGAMADLIVKAAVKEALDDKNVASDFYDALDERVEELLEDASRRAEQNDRKTVQPRDL
jgi:histone H3/H4